MFQYIYLLLILVNISLCTQDKWIIETQRMVNPLVMNGVFKKNYTYSVNKSVEYIFQFNRTGDTPACVSVESYDSNKTFPVLVVVRQQRGIMSWQLPLIVETLRSSREYYKTNRTLCPHNNYATSGYSASTEDFIVSISSESLHNVSFSLFVKTVDYFFIGLSQIYEVIVSPSEPSYFVFKFQENYPDTVLLQVNSSDDTCTAVSIQNLTHPVFDLEKTVQFEGYWQTVSSKGGITLRRDAFPIGFYVVFVVKGEDFDCTGVVSNPTDSISNPRRKSLTFQLLPGITYKDYLIATFCTVAVFILVYVFCFVIGIVYYIKRRRQPSEMSYLDDDSCASPSSSVPPVIYGQIQSPASDAPSVPRCNSDSSLDETDIDMLHDADSEKDIFRTKTCLYLCDLARKEPRILRKKSNLYLWNLLTVAVFYSLPVVQLVITYQMVLNRTGDQDLCYYNFLCAHPLGVLSDFNHVFSNIGYVLFGLLFILLTWRRDIMHRRSDQRLDKYYGIPQHYGLFYALGVALMMEGLLSGCYHVCPNHSNFQFDTSFMYVISMLCMLKIYHNRHPDINASAYSTFALLAVVIMVGMIGVLNGNISFWIGFTIIHLSICMLLSVQIYYMGRWKFNLGIFRRVFSLFYHDLRASPWQCMRPNYPSRMVLLILGNAANWGLAVVGIMNHQKDFATYLLSVFMANLLLYTMFYIVMKLCHRERILPQPLIYIILACLAWAAALYFFLNKSISWALTPAQSKHFNQPCAMFSFYDNHDIWHFLSGASMFFSFMVLLTLDDDLIFIHRSKISVF